MSLGGRGTTHEGVRRRNLAVLARMLHRNGPATRSELTAATGLNRSTVGALTAELAELDLVDETPGAATGAAARTGRAVGRPSILVRPSPQRATVLAADLRVGGIEVALVGFGGAILARSAIDTSTAATHPPARLVDRLARSCRRVLQQLPPGAVCVGLGVGVPGLVHDGDDIVREAPNLRWTDVPLGAMLRTRLGAGLPIWVRNDADLGALAEHIRGAARGAHDVIYVAGHVGVGGGVIVADRMLTGADGYGGEIGHMMVNPRGRQCRCGAVGCWETEVGESVLTELAARPGEQLSVDDVVRRAAAGDARAAKALRQVGGWIGMGVANLVNAFSPEVVVFGGPLGTVLPAVRPIVETAVSASLVGRRQQIRLVGAELGVDSTLIGAAEMAFEPLLDDPLGLPAFGAAG